MLARLRHRPVGRRHDEDRAVHRRRAGDHVLDVVGVARAVNVRVVALGRLVLDVRRVDRDAARLLLGRLVDVGVPLEVGAAALRLAHHLGDRRRERGFAVVDVADRADVHVRLRALPRAVRHVAERADERRRGNSPSGRRSREAKSHRRRDRRTAGAAWPSRELAPSSHSLSRSADALPSCRQLNSPLHGPPPPRQPPAARRPLAIKPPSPPTCLRQAKCSPLLGLERLAQHADVRRRVFRHLLEALVGLLLREELLDHLKRMGWDGGRETRGERGGVAGASGVERRAAARAPR